MSKLQELLVLTDEELFLEYNEGEPERASKDVITLYKELNDMLEIYITRVQVEAFAHGFRYALSVMKGGEI